MRRAIRRELRAWRLDRIIFKIPYLTRAVMLLDHIFEDPLFVHIVRDGRAVALSTRRLFAEDGRSEADALRAAGEHWVETVDYVDRCAERVGERLRTVRYEDLCTDVDGTVAEMWRFCGLEPVPSRLADVPDTLRPTNDRHLEACSLGERDLLDHTVGDTLARWGYPRFADADGGDPRTTPGRPWTRAGAPVG